MKFSTHHNDVDRFVHSILKQGITHKWSGRPPQPLAAAFTTNLSIVSMEWVVTWGGSSLKTCLQFERVSLNVLKEVAPAHHLHPHQHQDQHQHRQLLVHLLHLHRHAKRISIDFVTVALPAVVV